MLNKEALAGELGDSRRHLGYATIMYTKKSHSVSVLRPNRPKVVYDGFTDYHVHGNWLLLRHNGECGTSYVACDLLSEYSGDLLTLEVPAGTEIVDVTKDGCVSCRLGNVEFERLIC